MSASALLIGASVASINLCSDEYLLLLARPGEIASVSYLSQDARESALWRRAVRHPANRGQLEGVVANAPRIVLTMGGAGRSTSLLAKRLGMQVVDLPMPRRLKDVAGNLRKVSAALGDPSRATPWLVRLRNLVRTSPAQGRDAIFISGAGESFARHSLGADWMRLAGYRQRHLADGRATYETLLASPPSLFLESNYRQDQMSLGRRWLDHPLVRRSNVPRQVTDGRRWTCMGPTLIPEIERLRRSAG